jgi:hypothetical protein
MTKICLLNLSICDLPVTTIQLKAKDNNNPTFMAIWSNQLITYVIEKVKAIDNNIIYA